jgi:hypothetical protein
MRDEERLVLRDEHDVHGGEHPGFGSWGRRAAIGRRMRHNLCGAR